MVLVGGGLLLLVIGGILFFLQKGQQAKADQILSVETSTCAALEQACQDVSHEIGPGSFQMEAEVKGTIEPAYDLRSEIRGEACVYYRTQVQREYEEDDWETDAEGDRKRVTRRGSEVVAETERQEKFWVQDATGRVWVNPEGARLEPLEVVDEFQPEESRTDGASLRLGNFSLSLGGTSERRRTLGFRYQEWIVPVHRQVYILGQASDASGQLCLERPTETGNPFLISFKTEEQLVGAARSAAQWMKIAGVIMLAGGGILFVLGLILGATGKG